MNSEQKALFDKMTALQQRVCTNIIKGMPEIDAYLDANPKTSNRNSAKSAVSRMLTNVNVKAFLDSIKSEFVSNAVMTRQEMLERLTMLARTSLSDLIEWRTSLSETPDGEEVEQSAWAIKESALLNQQQMASIAELSAGREGFKIKQHSPLVAMKQLADLEGYNAPSKTEVTGKDGGAIEVSDMSERELARRIAFTLAKAAKKSGDKTPQR